MGDERHAQHENAADRYALVGAAIPPQDWEALTFWNPGEPLVGPETLLGKNRDWIDEIEAATSLPFCRFPDFGKELTEPGIDSLTLSRRLSRLLTADALALMDAGRGTPACGRLAAVIRLGRHAGSGRVIMPMLVGAGIIDGALDTILHLDAEGRLPAEGAAVIDRALALVGDDPFDLRACIAAECVFIQAKLRARRPWFRRRGPLTAPIERASRRRRDAMAAELDVISARIRALPLHDANSADAIRAIENDLPIWTELVGPIFQRAQARSLEVADRCRQARIALSH